METSSQHPVGCTVPPPIPVAGVQQRNGEQIFHQRFGNRCQLLQRLQQLLAKRLDSHSSRENQTQDSQALHSPAIGLLCLSSCFFSGTPAKAPV